MDTLSNIHNNFQQNRQREELYLTIKIVDVEAQHNSLKIRESNSDY